MGWSWLTGDDWIKLLGQVLGPLLAAMITGCLLVYQSNRNARIAENARQGEITEVRRKEVLTARERWAGIFQESLMAIRFMLDELHRNAGVGYLDEVAHKERQVRSVDLFQESVIKVRAETARLLIFETDLATRSRVYKLSDSLQRSVTDRSNAIVAEKYKDLRGEFSDF